MKNIIIYASKYGTAEETSYLLKEKLRGETELVNVAENRDIDFSGYDNVIVGGSIYVGKIQKTISDFLIKNESKLLEKRLALFVCAGEEDQNKKEKQLMNNFPEKIYNKAVVKDVFGHSVKIDKVSFLEKMALRLIKNIKKSYSEIYFEVIENFADKINSMEE